MVARVGYGSRSQRGLSDSRRRTRAFVAGAFCLCVMVLVISPYAYGALNSSVLVPASHDRHRAPDSSYDLSGTAALRVALEVGNESAAPLSDGQRARELPFTFTLDPAGSLVEIDDQATYPLAIYQTNPDSAEFAVRTQTIKSGDVITLQHNQYALIGDLPKGALYEVVASLIPGYSLRSTTHQGHLLDDVSTSSFTYLRDERIRPLSSLTITKDIAGNLSEPDRVFLFEITFNNTDAPEFSPADFKLIRGVSDDPASLTGPLAGPPETLTVTQESPCCFSAQFTLSAGEAVRFQDLALGLTYALRELPVAGYTQSVSEVTGVISNPVGAVVPIVNHAGSVPNSKWNIDIVTNLHDLSADGSAELDKEFEFTMRIKTPGLPIGYQTGSVSYIITHADGSTTNDVINKTTGEVTETITLGDRVHLEGTNVDEATYTLIENSGSSAYYFGSFTTLSGTVRNGQNLALDWDVLYDPPGVVVPAVLKVSKAVEAGAPCTLHVSTYEVVFDNASPIRFTLTEGESLELATNTMSTYRVSEVIDPRDGYALSGVTGGQGTITGDNSLDSVTFTNRFLTPITTTIEGQVSFDVRGSAALLPQHVAIQLIDERTGAIIGTRLASTSDSWLFRFDDVVSVDGVGNAVPYTVRVQQSPHFTFAVSKLGETYFSVSAASFAPITANTPYVVKSMLPYNAPAHVFTYALTALDGAPLPSGALSGRATASVPSNGVATFGTIRFTAPGRYEYRIREIAGSDPSYTYDPVVYSLVYEVVARDTANGKVLVPTARLTRTDTNTAIKAIQSQSLYTPRTSMLFERVPAGGGRRA